MSAIAVLAAATPAVVGPVTTGEAVTFWIIGPIALAAALGMIFARNAVHSALFLVVTMLSLAVLYLIQGATFLGFVQIIVYTGAVMMLFLFVLMLVGRDSSDSVVEVLRGQRVAAGLAGIGFAILLVTGLARALTDVVPPGLGNDAWAGNLPGVGKLIFTDFLLPFELTSALLITAALGAIVFAYTGRHPSFAKAGQRAMVIARLRGEHARVSPLPGPGVFATGDSVATPAVLPDGSVAEDSLSDIIGSEPAERRDVATAADAHALTDGRSAEGASEAGTAAVTTHEEGGRA